MPELPDLKVYASNINKLICSKRVKEAVLFTPKSANVEKHEFANSIVGSSVSQVFAEGKELFINLDNGNTIGIHLMLLGECYYGNQLENDKLRYKIMSLYFKDDSCLTICDEQYFCKIKLNPIVSEVPEALAEQFSLDYFMSNVKSHPRKNVKAFLLDQKIVRGIGNAYADEILYKANISPKSSIGKIPEENIKWLYNSIIEVFNWAIKQIESIIPDRIRGEERIFLNVHKKGFTTTPKGERIIVEKVASKNTYYVEEQKLFR